MTIFDCFLYNGEKELLDIRVNEMKGLPVIHNLAESIWTFTAKRKPNAVLSKSIKTYTGFSIVHRKPPLDNPWDNEKRLRNSLFKSLLACHPQPSDIIILSDVDEIPCWGRVEEFNDDELCCLQMDEYHLFLNTRYREQSWRHPKIFKYQYMLDHPEMTFDMIRNAGGKVIEGGGWHFSSMGPAERILNKFKSFSHQEPEIQKAASIEHIQNCMNNLRHLHTNEPLTVIHDQGLGDIPTCIYHNQENFKHLLYV